MTLDLLLYFGVLASVGAIATVVLLLVLRRQTGGQGGVRRQRPSRTAARPLARVQVILPASGKPLVWVVDGRSYPDPNSVTEPEARALVEEFLGSVQEVAAAGLAPLPVPDTAPARPQAPAAPQVPTLAEEESQESYPASSEMALADNTRTSEAPTRLSGLSYEEELERPLLERLRASFLPDDREPTSVFQPKVPTSPSLFGRRPKASQDEGGSQAAGGAAAMPNLQDLDKILQARLSLMSDMPTASISSGANGLLEIMVAGHHYESINDVPDERVRAVMRESVRVWESQIR